MTLEVVILAAGKGTRMKSALPKVLHPLAGKPMVQHVIDSAKDLGSVRIHLVYGHGGELMQQWLHEPELNWVLQEQQLGTGHAMQVAMNDFNDDARILMLYGDTPLLSETTLKRLLEAQPDGGIALLTVELASPDGYGRILRDGEQVIGIVEHKDATSGQLAITEVNTGVMVARGADFKRWLALLSNDNAQGEYYVTDVIALAHSEGRTIRAVLADNPTEVEGVNNKLQLANLERAYQRRQAEQLMLAGVTLADPARFDLRGSLSHGSDLFIDVNAVIEGKVEIGHNVTIGPNCHLKDCVIGDNTLVRANSVIEQASVGGDCTVGPFARLRPGAVLADDAHVGNFVEMKNASLGQGSKANHLTYLGDAEIGAGVNIGAGTITCNYDGANKHRTVIGDGVFIGSDSQLVAPVTIGTNATVGAGSTITRNVGEGELVIPRVKQRHIGSWARPQKQK